MSKIQNELNSPLRGGGKGFLGEKIHSAGGSADVIVRKKKRVQVNGRGRAR